MEKYESDYNDYQKEKEKFEAWEYQQEKNKNQSTKKFKSTDENIKFYNEMHENVGEEPEKDYYQPNEAQKNSELHILLLKCFKRLGKWYYKKMAEGYDPTKEDNLPGGYEVNPHKTEQEKEGFVSKMQQIEEEEERKRQKSKKEMIQ